MQALPCDQAPGTQTGSDASKANEAQIRVTLNWFKELKDEQALPKVEFCVFCASLWPV